MSSQIIVPQSISGEVSIHSSGASIKAELLTAASKVATVSGEESRELAITASSLIKQHLTAVEKSRKQVTEPLLNAQRQIMELAKSHTYDLMTQLNRLNAAISEYDEIEREKREEQARLQRMEDARIERERQAALKAAEDKRLEALRTAEEERLAAETRKRELEARHEALEAKGKPLTKAQIMENLRMEVQAEEEAEAAAQKAREIATAPLVIAEPVRTLPAPVLAPSSIGSGGRSTTEYEVTILDLVALQKAYPHCVKMEPNLSNIKALLKAKVDVPGVSFVTKQVFAAKAAL